jgi:hypothetical protein
VVLNRPSLKVELEVNVGSNENTGVQDVEKLLQGQVNRLAESKLDFKIF